MKVKERKRKKHALDGDYCEKYIAISTW